MGRWKEREGDGKMEGERRREEHEGSGKERVGRSLKER